LSKAPKIGEDNPVFLYTQPDFGVSMGFSKKAQSIMEYIGVSLAFTTAGVLFFAAANNAMVLELRGGPATVGGNNLISQVIGPNNAVPWPNGWNPDTGPVEIGLDDPGYCQQLDSEDCSYGGPAQ